MKKLLLALLLALLAGLIIVGLKTLLIPIPAKHMCSIGAAVRFYGFEYLNYSDLSQLAVCSCRGKIGTYYGGTYLDDILFKIGVLRCWDCGWVGCEGEIDYTCYKAPVNISLKDMFKYFDQNLVFNSTGFVFDYNATIIPCPE